MLARANSDAGTHLRRSKSASTVHKRPASITEHLDLDTIKQQALAAATAAFARAQAQDAADRTAKRSSEVARSKSSASRKSLTSQGSHFPPRDSSFRSLQRPNSEQTRSTHRLPQASTGHPEQNTEQFPPFYPTPSVHASLSVPRHLSTQPSVTFSENARPSSQPKSFRQNTSSSITSQQIRKARSMYYASSVQTGSPIARPPSKYLTTPPPVSASPASEPSSLPLPSRTLRPSPLASPRMPVTVGPNTTLDKVRDEYLQGFQQKAVKHKPSVFLAPFKKRQDKGKDKGKRVASETLSFPTSYQQTPDESTTDLALSEFMPAHEVKEKRSFSGSLKNKIKKVFRRTSGKSTNLPVQQIDASRDYFHTAHYSPPSIKDALGIPPPNEETLQRIRARTPSLDGTYPVFLRSGSRSNSTGSNRSLHSEANATNVSASRVTSWGTSTTSDTLTQRAMKRMTVIHESKDSIGSEADRVASVSASRRKSLPLPPLASFRDPMPMEILTEESPTPVDPKRVFSALMKEIGSSKSQTSPNPVKRTPGAESDVFESSTTKLFSYSRELDSSGSRNLRSSIDLDHRPPSRRPATSQSAQSKTSSIRSFGRAIRSTIRTVTPIAQHSSSAPDATARVYGNEGERRGDDRVPSSATTPRSDDSQHDSDSDERNCAVQVFTPSTSQIEKRVERAKERRKTPLEEAEHVNFPRETDRTYDVTTFAQQTQEHSKSVIQPDTKVEPGHGVVGHNICRLPMSPKASASPSSRAAMTPMSPSIYSRNTDGISILPNDSVMSFGGHSELDRSHNGGSAVISTSQSVRSYVVGTPSPQRRGSTRTSRDWRAWLSHEISGMELTSQEDLRIHDQYTTSSKKVRSDSIRTSHTEHEDTTVVLRGSLDVTTPRPGADHSPKTGKQHVHGRWDSPESKHGENNGVEAANLAAEKIPSLFETQDGNARSYSPSESVDTMKHHEPPQLKSTSHSERPLSRPRSQASVPRPVFETPRSPSINDRFSSLDTGRHASSNSLCSRDSKPPTVMNVPTNSRPSPKLTPGSKATADMSAPAMDETSQRVPNTALRRNDAQSKRKENVTPPSIRSQKKPTATPLGLSTRPNSQQLLCSSTTPRNSPSIIQHHTPEGNETTQKPSPAATPSRIRICATLRPMSPEKLARRPRSAFDLRGANNTGRPTVIDLDKVSPLPGSDLRRPALHLKTSSSSLAMSKEPNPDAMSVGRAIDTVLDGERSGSVTPGQRMADRFLKQRKSTPALEGSAE
ncbi:hypothetical protein G6011_08510 [Alternaria panax]|uniref:Uncharacterized protein n=1 Tax=Alternaria panax TaxID=48097 RepID=A0AAD4I8P1_9PLEO|nr:hypothetical protein G6011_08510 [Alternaria panax]